MKNFANGSLVFRIWHFDGSGEVLAKFQYFSDAKAFAERRAAEETREDISVFYLAACEAECEVASYFPKHLSKRLAAQKVPS